MTGQLTPETEMVSESVPWYAVYTRSRHEKAVHASLAGRGVESFLPLRDVLSQWKDRRKWVAKPLFPGYVFVRLPRQDLWLVHDVPGVVLVVGADDGPFPVPEEQIVAVRAFVERPVQVDPWPYIRKGQRVLVKAGPLIGLEGFFVYGKGKARLVISIDMLGRSVAAEVDADCVEPLESPVVA